MGAGRDGVRGIRRRLRVAFEEGNGWGFLWLGAVSVLICLTPGFARGIAYGDWTSLGRLAAGLFVLGTVAALVFAARAWLESRSYKLGRELLDVYNDFDLEIEGDASDEAPDRERVAAFGEGREGAPEVVGEWSGRAVRVRRGTSGGERSVFEVDVSGDVPGDLVIRNRSLSTLAVKYVGFEELGSDHGRFSEDYTVRARDSDRGARALDDLRLEDLFGETLADRAPEVHLEEGRLRLVREEEPESVETVAERLEQLRMATEAFVRHVDASKSGDSSSGA